MRPRTWRRNIAKIRECAAQLVNQVEAGKWDFYQLTLEEAIHLRDLLEKAKTGTELTQAEQAEQSALIERSYLPPTKPSSGK